MSKYTTEVRFICETLSGLIDSEGYSSIDSILDTAAPLIFDFDYPIFDENYRIPLEKKILKHFYTREISEETIGLWKLRLDDTMNMIMPYFNQLYNSELIEFNPLYDTDVTTSHTGKENGNATNEHHYTQLTKTDKSGNETFDEQNVSKNSENTNTQLNKNATTERDNEQNRKSDTVNGSESKSSSESKQNTNNTSVDTSKNYDLYSDTPQGGLTGVDNETYLTNARKITNEDANSNTENMNSESNVVDESTTYSSDNTLNKEKDNISSEEMQAGTQSRDNNGTLDKEGSRVNTEKSVTDYTNSGTGGNKFNNTNEYVENIIGKRGYGSYSKMLMEFRDTFLNIDKMVIDSLEPLFFSLW